MASKKTSLPSSFCYDAKKTPGDIASALKVLAKRYPGLSGKKGSCELVFKLDEKNPSNCSVELKDNVCTVTYGKLHMALRMVGNIISGVIPEKAEYCPFEMFGVMIDCSRNAVMTVDYMKTVLDRLAILGYNMVMLYTEETYKIESEPYFGLMRGAYTPAEIHEIDDYAAKLGIEMIPCIQTLAHLEQMFRWPKFADINDIYGILLAEDPKTYELVEKMLTTWKNNVRSRRIHLGMDEAHGVGSGKYKELHGEKSKFDIINKHLAKVADICKKLDLEPMIWSDMYFRIGSKKNDYYDKESVIPASVGKKIPKNVELVYWDYYHEDKDFYNEWIKRHRDLAGEPLMGSGVWTWNKFWYDHYYTTQTVVPCIEACRESKVKDVFFTMWGDDGGFCDFDSAFAGLAFSSELACTGVACDKALNSKYKVLFDGSSYDDVITLADSMWINFPSMIWDDPLMLMYLGASMERDYGVYKRKFNWKNVKADVKKAADIIDKAKNKGNGGNIAYGRALIDAIQAKLLYTEALIKAYSKKNAAKEVAKMLPLAEDYLKAIKKFAAEMRNMWMSHNKTFGYETIQIRLAGQVARAEEAVKRLTEFADGKAMSIPELDDLFSVKKNPDFGWGSYPRLAHGTTIV